MSRLLLSFPLALILSFVVNPIDKRVDRDDLPKAMPAVEAHSPFGLIPAEFRPDRPDDVAAMASHLKVTAAMTAGMTIPGSMTTTVAVPGATTPDKTVPGTTTSDAAAATPTLPPPAGDQVAAIAAAPPSGVADDLKFGISAPFTGPSKDLGKEMKLGIETAFNAANDAGGIDGHHLKLIAVDDGYEPSRTGDAMKKLIEQDQVLGTIGNVGTPTAAVALPYALAHKNLFFGALSGANLLRAVPPDHYVFNYRPSYAEETEAVVKYLLTVRNLRPQDIAVFAQQDAFGESGYAGVTKALRAAGRANAQPLLLNYARNTIDVDDAVAKLKAKRNTIKAIVMVATYRAAAKFIEKTRLTHPAMIYTNVSFVGSTSLADELMLLGPKYADGIIVTQVVPDVGGYSKTVLDYKADLQKYFPGEAPDYVSFEGYLDAKILIDGLRKAGTDVTTEKVIDALESLHDIDLGIGVPLGFSASNHQASHKIWGSRLDAEGHYKPLDLD